MSAIAADMAPAPVGVISGSVFRDAGFALAGADVEVAAKPSTEASKEKPKTYRARSDARGEFAIRVAAGGVGYTVSVRASGFEPQSKAVTVQPGEQVNLFFRLEAAPNPTGGKKTGGIKK